MKKLILFFVLLISTFLLGRLSVKIPPGEEKYVSGDTIKGSLAFTDIEPVRTVLKDSVILSIIYKDSIINVPMWTPETSRETVKDWNLYREYSQILFDNDTIGKLEIRPSVQYNRLVNIDYTYMPKVKQVTIYKERLYTPYVGVTYNSFEQLSMRCGLYKKNIGGEFSYIIGKGKSGFGIGLNISF